VNRAIGFARAFLFCALVPALLSAEVRIEVDELPGDRWRITYLDLEAAESFRFAHETFYPRAESWEVGSEAACSLTVEEGRETLDCPQGLPSSLSFELPTDTRIRQKGYPLHVAFSDGGRLFYSGHLALQGVAPTTLCFRALEGRLVILRGKTGPEVCWEADAVAAEDGLFVFFGASGPEATEALALIADRGLPVWLRDRTVKILPRLFDHFRERFGLSLPWTPTVLLSWSEKPSSGRTFAGSTLDAQLQVHLEGVGWQEPDAQALEGILFHLAHEVAHLWNGQLARLRFDPAEEWLKEGGADFLAGQALADLGLLSAMRWQQREDDAERECRELLGDRSLATPLDNRGVDYRALYACGLHFAALIDSEAGAAAGGGVGFTALTGRVLSGALGEDGAYESWDYFAALQAVAGAGAGRKAHRLLTVGFENEN